ncbi:lycopene cyclase domain-containing protein [Arthrobacter sp. G119Y2]|uniref:lycopene cyclase domain-containing protein n=1 Tax=Arthrobacter sp. G119Y2 TaxID=3134965 RepID=UPI00311A65FC
MTYWALNAVFLVPAAAVLVLALLRRRRASAESGATKASGKPGAPGGKGMPAALAVTAVVLLVLTAVFDNVMIAAGLFWYNPERISGAFIGSAPLEDFAYALAAVLLLPALWVLLEKRPKAPERDSAEHSAERRAEHSAEHEEKQ